MNLFLIFAIQVASMIVQSIIFSYALSFPIYDFINKMKSTEENRKRKAIQWLIFYVLFLLSGYVYTVRQFLFY
jgi:hypothetical protein